MTFIVVTNNGSDVFRGPTVRYDGIDYEFRPAVPVTITLDAARHIFGIGLGDKTSLLAKHGWMTNSGDTSKAMQKLNSFSFTSPDDIQTASEETGSENEETGHSDAEQEQGTAPLQTGSAVEPAVPDGTVGEAAQPTTQEAAAQDHPSESILDRIKSFTGS